MNEKQWLAVHYLIINPYICIYERRCVIIANLLRCYRIWAWSCTSVHSLRPHPLAPCILAILTHLQGCIQNVYFDTPSLMPINTLQAVFISSRNSALSRLKAQTFSVLRQKPFKTFSVLRQKPLKTFSVLRHID